jgi:hypothetical protein
VAGPPISHGHGLQQGDTLSPLLFNLGIDPLQQVLDIATAHGLLHKVRRRGPILRTSLYADDAIIFLAPLREDIRNLACILKAFGEVTGLCTNFQKSSVVPIHCHGVALDDILEDLPIRREKFPIKYLGLPLSVWQLKNVDFQPLIDKMAGKIPTWDGKFINMAGRTALVKSVIASQAIYHLTPLVIPPPVLDNMKKIERAFLWTATSKSREGNAKSIGRWFAAPKILGGLECSMLRNSQEPLDCGGLG